MKALGLMMSGSGFLKDLESPAAKLWLSFLSVLPFSSSAVRIP